MTAVIHDTALEERLIAQRRASGANQYDEVWEGVYVMAPMANDEHQHLVSRLSYILEDVLGLPGEGDVRPGVNVSDYSEDWQFNYRIPDVAVFLTGGKAENLGTHWRGGPDFLIEITSSDDQTYEKMPFYSRIDTGEVLVVNRDLWQLELYRGGEEEMTLVEMADTGNRVVLQCQKVPLSFSLQTADLRPEVHVTCTGDDEPRRSWVI